MHESSKTNALRSQAFKDLYFNGRVLDIGAGTDPVCAHAEVFDQQHGDANKIDKYFAPHTFDTVHSSHCLEHMQDPLAALQKWWSLVKPNGYLVTVVPDEDLYEQGIWPSFFNKDHLSSFRIDKPTPLSAVSHDVVAIHIALPDAQLVDAQMQSVHYDFDLLFHNQSLPKRLRHPLKAIYSILKRVTITPTSLHNYQKWLVKQGYPFDQTSGKALAQIQVIVQKRNQQSSVN